MYCHVLNGVVDFVMEATPSNVFGGSYVDEFIHTENESVTNGWTYDGVNFIAPIQAVYVQQTIQKWQAELILHDMGMLPTIQSVISADTAMSIVYQGVTSFDRTNGLITQVAALQNIPNDVIDNMFIAASRYTAEMATDQSAREAIMREAGLIS